MRYITLFISMFCTQIWGMNDVRESLQVKLVELQVRVRDNSDKPVYGLGADAFTVTENGVVQTIDDFAEIDATIPRDDTAVPIRPRILLMVDFEWTTIQNVKKIIHQLKKLVTDGIDPEIELALAFMDGGIHEYRVFSKDRGLMLQSLDDLHKLFSKRPFLTQNEPDSEIFRSAGGDRAYKQYRRHRVSRKLPTLTRFINYLGAYQGNKDIIIVSDQLPGLPQQMFDLRPFQSACLANKVMVHVVNTSPTSANIQGDPSQYAAWTQMVGGLSYRTLNKGIQLSTNKVIEAASRYYRIRFYSNTEKKGFRKLRVKVAGAGRHVYFSRGYRADTHENRTPEVNPIVADNANSRFRLELETDWVTWERKGRYRVALLALGHRIFDAEGRLLRETVSDLALTKSTPRERVPLVMVLERSVVGFEADRTETIVIDLLSGDRVVLRDGKNPFL